MRWKLLVIQSQPISPIITLVLRSIIYYYFSCCTFKAAILKIFNKKNSTMFWCVLPDPHPQLNSTHLRISGLPFDYWYWLLEGTATRISCTIGNACKSPGEGGFSNKFRIGVAAQGLHWPYLRMRQTKSVAAIFKALTSKMRPNSQTLLTSHSPNDNHSQLYGFPRVHTGMGIYEHKIFL